MTAKVFASSATGLLGPVAHFGGVVLLVFSPIMRGGNRHAALIGLELLALGVIVAIAVRMLTVPDIVTSLVRKRALVLLIASPALLAVVYLTPLPLALWTLIPGRGELALAMLDAGVNGSGWRPASISPGATASSLLAGIPLVACLLSGYLASLAQLRVLLRAVVAIGFFQVALGLAQTAGGEFSPFYFGTLTFGPPVGTFANRNHFANYLVMALVALLWLAYESNRDARSTTDQGLTERHRTIVWAFGGLILSFGIVLSRSRGAAVFGLPFAGLALVAICLRTLGSSRGWKVALALAATGGLLSLGLAGYDSIISRLSADQLATSADFRGRLARTTLEAAWAYFPIGSGWGTFELAYPRFQPASLPGYANEAHMDYVQMLLEGGIFAVVFGAAFVALFARRTCQLAQRARIDRTLDRESMAATLAGLGLMALLFHSLVEFNMRIPANAMLGALLFGVFVRPLHAPPTT